MVGKKSFKEQPNPALDFISTKEPEAPATQIPKATEPPEGYKLNPLYVETKSRRMQLLVQPSVYEGIKAKATAQGKSINEFVHELFVAELKGDK